MQRGVCSSYILCSPTQKSDAIFRKPKSSSAAAAPPSDPIENEQSATNASIFPSLPHETRDAKEMSDIGAIPGSNEWRDVRSQEGNEDGDSMPFQQFVDPINDSRAVYSSSVAHSASQQRVDLRWSTICAQSSRNHDCEYIARKWPQRFVVHSILNSAANMHMPLIMESAGAHVWHSLATAVGKSIQLKHGLLQVFLQEPFRFFC